MKKLFILPLLIIALSLLIWQATIYVYRYNQPIEIVDIIKSDDGYLDYLMVKNPPLNEKQFIRWWHQHKDDIKEQYDVPSLSRDGEGLFQIGVWSIGEGFDFNKDGQVKANKYLLLFYEQICFDELSQDKRCLEKDNLYVDIGHAKGGWYYIHFHNGGKYIHWGDGNFVKSQYDQPSVAMKQLLTIFLLIFVLSLLLWRNVNDLCRSKQKKSLES